MVFCEVKGILTKNVLVNMELILLYCILPSKVHRYLYLQLHFQNLVTTYQTDLQSMRQYKNLYTVYM